MDEKRYVLRLPPELYALIEQRAKKRLRSVNNEIIILLKLGLMNDRNEVEVIEAVEKLLNKHRPKPKEE